jgi:hypothetical protein
LKYITTYLRLNIIRIQKQPIRLFQASFLTIDSGTYDPVTITVLSSLSIKNDKHAAVYSNESVP